MLAAGMGRNEALRRPWCMLPVRLPPCHSCQTPGATARGGGGAHHTGPAVCAWQAWQQAGPWACQQPATVHGHAGNNARAWAGAWACLRWCGATLPARTHLAPQVLGRACRRTGRQVKRRAHQRRRALVSNVATRGKEQQEAHPQHPPDTQRGGGREGGRCPWAREGVGAEGTARWCVLGAATTHGRSARVRGSWPWAIRCRLRCRNRRAVAAAMQTWPSLLVRSRCCTARLHTCPFVRRTCPSAPACAAW